MKVFDTRSAHARRGAGLLLSGAVWGVALFNAAPAAQGQGTTNPAKNPYPVTVAIDGQTYGDGRDTLPGYDDELCTPIPNVQYDFAENQVLYYNGEGELLKTARWTEWSRISSYQTWLDQQNAGTPTPTATATATPAPTSTAPTSTAPTSTAPESTAPTSTVTGPAAKSPSTKRQTTKSPATKSPSTTSQSASSPSTSSTPKVATSSPAAKTGTSTASTTENSTATNDDAAAAPAVDSAPADAAGTAAPAAPSAPASGAATPSPGAAAASSAASPQTTTNYKLASERTGLVGDAPDTRLAGVGILAGLLAVACFCLLFGELRYQTFGRRKAPR